MRRKGQPGNANLPIGVLRAAIQTNGGTAWMATHKSVLDGFVFRITKIFEIALGAPGFASLAHPAAMPDQLVGK
jgi:hypothetical protein